MSMLGIFEISIASLEDNSIVPSRSNMSLGQFFGTSEKYRMTFLSSFGTCSHLGRVNFGNTDKPGMAQIEAAGNMY